MSRGISDFQSGSGLADFQSSDTLDLKVMNVEYTEQGGRPIVHLFGRDAHGEWHHIEVEGHRPSFYIREEAFDATVENHYAVHHVEHRDEDGERYRNLHEEPLVRIYTELPGQVGGSGEHEAMRDLFAETYEADVFYTKRWLIDNEVYTGVRIDTSDAEREGWVEGDMRVGNDDVTPLSLEDTPEVEPKRVVVDIEVAGEGEVPDTDKAEYPISTIVAWDSDREEYVGWMLRHDSHDLEVDDIDLTEVGLNSVRLFDDESAMLHDFNEYVEHQRPDILTGWYSNDFDIPYLVNRCRKLNTYNYRRWSPIGEVYISRFEPVVKGVSCIDMLEAYKKTQIHKLKKKGLDDIALKELDVSKVEIQLSHTEMWKEDPVEFLRYNKRDVELVHEIDDSRGVIDLLDNLRAVVGCSYSDPIGGNIDMMDTMFLRKAREYGYALPTAVKPEVGSYHGAYVYTPEPGLHKHVVYPDYSSLYPNMMYQCNISPETLIGTQDDLDRLYHGEEHCVWSYIDTATPPSQKKDKEAEEDDMERVYFVDPEYREGFVRSVLDDIMGLAAEYTGDMYEAVKRVRNSTYGVMGDSDSYGRGFRLFDWRLAEATTLGGQRVLKEGGRRFAEYVDDPDARVIYGDTDSVVTTFPNVDTAKEALDQAFDAADELNEYLDEYAAEQFGLSGPDEARMEIEIESYASGIFFKGDDNGTSDQGTKKRYAQMIEWNDDDGWLDEPDMEIKGFEYVRSDVSDITSKLQKEVFEALLSMDRESAEAHVKELVKEVIRDIVSGEADGGTSLYTGLDDLGIPFGIGQALSKYGSTERKPQPQYRGAKYANREIYGGEAITPGDKPLYFYIKEGATGDLRKTYKAATKEDGLYVDAVSVLEARDLPEGVRVDRHKMVDKTVISPLEPIFNTLGWGTEWMETAKERATPPEFYRDEEQTGFDAADFM